MYLCENGHDEICYDQKSCPVCELLKINSDQEDEIFDLKEEIKDLQEAKS